MRYGVLLIVLFMCGWGCRQGMDSAAKSCVYNWGTICVDREKIFLGAMAAGGECIDSLRVYNPGSEAVTLSLASRFADMICEAPCLHVAPYTTEIWKLHIRVKENIPPGEAFELLAFLVNDIPLAGYSIPVNALVTENFEDYTAEQLENAPVMVIDDSVREIRCLKGAQTVSVSFFLGNIGKEDLKIQKIETSCGCVGTEITERLIPPGSSEELRVRVHIDSLGQFQEQSVRLYNNAPASPVREFWVRKERKELKN